MQSRHAATNLAIFKSATLAKPNSIIQIFSTQNPQDMTENDNYQIYELHISKNVDKMRS